MKKKRRNIAVHNTNTDHFSKLLKSKGYKVTQGRVSILKIFSEHHIPLTAENIHSLIKKSNIDVATIYRTLKSFEKSNILNRVDLRGDSVYFELSSHHHHHLVCKKCGDIEDVDVCGMDKLSGKILKKSKYFNAISEHSLEFFGICKQCSK